MLRMQLGITQDTIAVGLEWPSHDAWRIPRMWKTIGWLSAMTLSFIGLLIAMAIIGLKGG